MAKSNPTLSDKETAFVEHYLRNWNGADAARKAGYEPHNARHTAHELLTKPHIKRAIQERAAVLFMSTEEWAARVTEQARASLESFLTDKGEIEVSSKSENLHLLESYETEETFKKNEEGTFDKVIRKKVKLHSVQKALQMIAQRLGLLDSPQKKQLQEIDIELGSIKIAQEINKERLLDLIKRKCTPEIYQAVYAALGENEEASKPTTSTGEKSPA